MPTPAGLAREWRERSAKMNDEAAAELSSVKSELSGSDLAVIVKKMGMADALMRCANDIESSDGGWEDYDDEMEGDLPEKVEKVLRRAGNCSTLL
jgi:hypothetical protein